MLSSTYLQDYKRAIKRLREVRLSVGLKQSEVATKLKKPQSYISKIESGERRIDIAELKQLAKIYNKDIDYFI